MGLSDGSGVGVNDLESCWSSVGSGISYLVGISFGFGKSISSSDGWSLDDLLSSSSGGLPKGTFVNSLGDSLGEFVDDLELSDE